MWQIGCPMRDTVSVGINKVIGYARKNIFKVSLFLQPKKYMYLKALI